MIKHVNYVKTDNLADLFVVVLQVKQLALEKGQIAGGFCIVHSPTRPPQREFQIEMNVCYLFFLVFLFIFQNISHILKT